MYTEKGFAYLGNVMFSVALWISNISTFLSFFSLGLSFKTSNSF